MLGRSIQHQRWKHFHQVSHEDTKTVVTDMIRSMMGETLLKKKEYIGNWADVSGYLYLPKAFNIVKIWLGSDTLSNPEVFNLRSNMHQVRCSLASVLRLRLRRPGDVKSGTGTSVRLRRDPPHVPLGLRCLRGRAPWEHREGCPVDTTTLQFLSHVSAIAEFG
jgi:hypothetical protein